MDQITTRHTTLASDGNTYDVLKLIELSRDLPTEFVELDEFEALKHDNCWKDRRGKTIRPQDIIDLASAHQSNSGEPLWNAMALAQPRLGSHILRVRDADYEQYPLLTYQDENGLQVADGAHRLTKAWILGVDSIQTRNLPELPQAAQIDQDTS